MLQEFQDAFHKQHSQHITAISEPFVNTLWSTCSRGSFNLAQFSHKQDVRDLLTLFRIPLYDVLVGMLRGLAAFDAEVLLPPWNIESFALWSW